MALTNSAAWLSTKDTKTLEVKHAPYTPPGAGELVVKNGAVAINPVDWGKQVLGDLVLSYIRYPFILGCDVAGEVVEVGSDVHRFQVGDRVLGQAVGGAPAANRAAEGAFQQFTIIREHLAAHIPDQMSYERACVLPLALSTAAYGLFHKDFLALKPPTVPPPPQQLPGTKANAIVITGGASSVGCNAIQLAVSAGYQVYSTASPKNFDYVTQLGATRVFDYHSTTWAADMVAELKGKTVVGAYAIGNGSVEGCFEILRHADAGSTKLIAYAGFPSPDGLPTTFLGKAGFVGSTVWWMFSTAGKSMVKGVKAKFIDVKDVGEADCVVSTSVYKDFLPRALASSQLVPAPEPLVVGKGLDKIQEAMDLQMKGVSSQKIVVLL